VPGVLESLDGQGAGDHDQPYAFARRPRANAPYPTSTEELLASTAHDLRLPMSHIKGFVTSLRRDDLEWDAATRRELLAEIELETDRLPDQV
jgi:K+-sensing histidine kinase KdpD